MNRSRAALATSALFMLCTSVAGAQLDSSLTGERVRVRVRDVHRQAALAPRMLELRGNVTRVDPSGVTLQLPTASDPVTIPRAAIIQLAVSRGVPSRPASAVQGLVGGAVVGAVWGYLLHVTELGREDRSAEDHLRGGIKIGAVTGAALGLLSPRERWRRIRRTSPSHD